MKTITKNGDANAPSAVKKRGTNSRRKSATTSEAKQSRQSTTRSNPGAARGSTKSVPAKEKKIEKLLDQISSLYDQIQQSRKEQLAQGITLGGVLKQLKDAAGRGKFESAVRRWISEGRLKFKSHKTAERYMAYHTLQQGGKFTDEFKNDRVSSLADAERIRTIENAKKKRRKQLEEAWSAKNAKSTESPRVLAKKADRGKPGEKGNEGVPLPALKHSQIQSHAQKYSKPASEDFAEFELETRRLLLEEVVETHTKELETLTEEAGS